MGQPKAKWEWHELTNSGVWVAAVGPYTLDAVVFHDGGTWTLSHGTDASRGLQELATGRLSPPCDVADLMRLAEAELARRLHGAAETMDGRGLVAEPKPFAREYAGERVSYCSANVCPGHATASGLCDSRAVRSSKPVVCADGKTRQMFAYACKRCGVESLNTSPTVDMCPPCRGDVPDGVAGSRAAAEAGAALVRKLIASQLCAFETCADDATHRRGSMSYCDTHTREHDINAHQAAIEQAKRATTR